MGESFRSALATANSDISGRQIDRIMSALTSMSRPKYVAYVGRPAMSFSRDDEQLDAAHFALEPPRPRGRGAAERPESWTAARNWRNAGVKISSRVSGVSVLPVVETRTENRT